MTNLLPIIRFHGDVERGKRLNYFARKQLNILHNAIQLRGLKQLGRQLHFADGTVIQCYINHGISTINIYCPPLLMPTLEDNLELIYPILTIVYGDYEGTMSYSLDTSIACEGFEVGEAIICSDEGSGIIAYAGGSTLYGPFEMCHEGTFEGEDSGCEANIIDCKRKVFRRLYQYYDILSNFTVTDVPSDILYAYTGASAFDDGILSNRDCGSTYRVVLGSWSKTYDELIVTAYIFFDSSLGSTFWTLNVSYKNNFLSWDTGQPLYLRKVPTTSTGSELTDTFMGFDIWREDEDYYLCHMSEYEALFNICKINTETMSVEDVSWSRSIILDEKYEDVPNQKCHIRLIGFGRLGENNFKAYWCWLEAHNYYYEEDLLTGDIVQTTVVDEGQILSAIWNHLTRNLFIVSREYPNDPVAENSGTSAFNHYYAFGYNNYLSCYIPCDPVYMSVPGCDDPLLIWNARRNLEEDDRPNIFAGAYTDITVNQDTVTYYNNFYVHEDSYDQGTFTSRSQSTGERRTYNWLGVCVDVPLYNEGYPLDYAYSIWDIYHYSLDGLFVSPDDQLSYRYDKRKQTDNFEYDPWETFSEGPNQDLIASSFPYDSSWKALLLHGQTVESHDNYDELYDVESWGCYKRSTDGTFVVLDNASAIKVEVIDKYRAFFKQQELYIVSEED